MCEIKILNHLPNQNMPLKKVFYVILLVMLTIPYLSENFIQMLITLTNRIKIPLKNFFFQRNNFFVFISEEHKRTVHYVPLYKS